jgi:hypothetical protein
MENSENLAAKFAHIKGWGIDADPDDHPNYPFKKYNGDDHKRLDYERSVQQKQDVELLKSTERPEITRVFGTTVPPSGLSGAIRRVAYKYSENRYAHWLPLLLADRVQVIEGIIEDLSHGVIPNIPKEKGIVSEWQHNKKELVGKVAAGVVLAGVVVAMLHSRSKDKVIG